MKYNKLFVSLLLMIMVITFTITSFAGSPAIYDKSSASTGQFVVTIYRPEGDETKFEKSYVICGSNKSKEDVKVELLIYNEAIGSYVALPDVDGENVWNISGSNYSTVFTKEVSLPNEGANKIRLVAYKKADAGNLRAGTNLQINNFTITVLNKSFINKIKDNLFTIPDIFKGIF